MQLSHTPSTQSSPFTKLSCLHPFVFSSKKTPFKKTAAFSLIEVVLAVGIFAFAMVAILGVFSATNNSTRTLLDRDALLTTIPIFRKEIQKVDAATIEDCTTTEPVMLYLFKTKNADSLDGKVYVTNGTPTAPTGEIKDGRLYRATITAATGGNMTAGRPGYPLQVLIDALPQDAATNSTNALEHITFHTLWNR